MKKILTLLFYCCMALVSLAQSEQDTLPPRKDTPVVKKKQDSLPPKKDTTVKKDTARKILVTRDSGIIRKPAPKIVDSSSAVVSPRAVIPPVQETTEATIPVSETIIEQPDAAQINSPEMVQEVLHGHPYYNFSGKPIEVDKQLKKAENKDGLFYFLAGLFFYYGLIRVFFGKYVHNMTSLFFRVTMRQQQLRDQMLQAALPSLLMNILFLISGGMFLTFVAIHYQITPITNRWLLLAWSSGLLMAIYLGKFIILNITGWIFNVRNATDTYIFIVFLVNKIIGIALLPVLALLAFSEPPFDTVILTLAFFMWFIFLIYRFIISYRPIRSEIKVSRFHFFLYLCAFEIAPLLLIYKVLLIFVERSY